MTDSAATPTSPAPRTSPATTRPASPTTTAAAGSEEQSGPNNAASSNCRFHKITIHAHFCPPSPSCTAASNAHRYHPLEFGFQKSCHLKMLCVCVCECRKEPRGDPNASQPARGSPAMNVNSILQLRRDYIQLMAY